MGHDITPLGNHNLNTENVESLAKDLSLRMHVNIEFGYYGEQKYFEILESDLVKNELDKSEFVKLGEFFKDENLETFRLQDPAYQLKQLFAKFANDIFYNLDYWIYYKEQPDEKTVAEEKLRLVYPDYEFRCIKGDESQYMYIYKHLFDDEMFRYGRWWSLCAFFVDNKQEDLEYLLQFRTTLMKHTFLFGGHKMYYLDDQSQVLGGVGQGSEGDMPLHDFEIFVQEKASDLLVNIPKFITDESYRAHFLSKGQKPLAFFDDFSDLKNNCIT